MSRWRHGVMITFLGVFDHGEKVVVGKSTLQFTHPGMGTGWWILSLHHEKALLVADGHHTIGKGLSNLVRLEEFVPADKQERCTERAKSLLPNSAYTPKNRKKLTYFFGGRPSRNVGMEWKYESN